MSTSRLAIGTANSNTFLRGDSTWAKAVQKIKRNSSDSAITIVGNYSDPGPNGVPEFYNEVGIGVDVVSGGQEGSTPGFTNTGVAKFNKSQFEAMCHEMNLVGWTATQGNRSSISSEVVTTDQMGGSIKKAQVGHVIISVAKTLQQKEMKLATIAVTKSRIGDDGIVFENCKFDNGMLEIDTESSVTFLGLEEQKEEQNRQRVKDLLEKRKQREQQKNSN